MLPLRRHGLLPVTGRALVEAARTCLGAPFVWGGRSKRFGLDCVGLILGAAKAAGVCDFEPEGYSLLVDSETLRRQLVQLCDRVDYGARPWERTRAVQAGDVLLFAFAGQPLHLGMATGESSFLHAWERAGRVVEQPWTPFWESRCAGVYRFRGLETSHPEEVPDE